MNAYWGAVWQIAAALAVFGLCVAVGGGLVIGGWIALRRLAGDSSSSAAMLGLGSASGAPSARRPRPRQGASGTSGPSGSPEPSRSSEPSRGPAGSSTAVDELPPPDSMGRTPKSALAARSASPGAASSRR